MTNYDNNTLVLTDNSYDDDYINPVKHVAYGGGFNGGVGLLRWTTNNVNTSGGNTIYALALHDMPVVFKTMYRSYPDSQLDTTTVPGSKVIYYNFQIMDNSPTSWANRENKVTTPGAGYKDTGWQYHVMKSVDESVINVLPIIQSPIATVTNLGGGSFRLDLVDQTIDKDWNDAAKNALFGGGHDGTTPARIKVTWTAGGAQVNTNYYPILKDTPTNTLMSHTFTGITSGTGLWYQVTVWDSHYQNAVSQAAAPTVKMTTGWLHVTAQ